MMIGLMGPNLPQLLPHVTISSAGCRSIRHDPRADVIVPRARRGLVDQARLNAERTRGRQEVSMTALEHAATPHDVRTWREGRPE